jgi:single-strand DNA-binding protein
MASLNKVMLIGNLTRDVEVRYTPRGTAVGEMGIAVNRRVSDGNGNWSDEVTFIDVTLWGKNAENAQKFLEKGRPVFIEGHLQLDSWEDKQSGQKRSKLKVVGETIQFLNSRGEKGAAGGKQSPSQPRGHESWDETDRRYEERQRQRQTGDAPAGGAGEDQGDDSSRDDDDIPF